MTVKHILCYFPVSFVCVCVCVCVITAVSAQRHRDMFPVPLAELSVGIFGSLAFPFESSS